ncbi:hypothetical protein L2E82_34323 [Cichorium intybus]|uniref:Uncharacterized protein n=1 Tax=Cichorium intybus TaxID=13427 RepID=A0ACB9BLX1_CICIN|nr:hypothetical protein L2E82_34323 [Cichorium intybus]
MTESMCFGSYYFPFRSDPITPFSLLTSTSSLHPTTPSHRLLLWIQVLVDYQGSLIVSSFTNIILGFSRAWGIFTRLFSTVIIGGYVCVVGLGLYGRGFPQRLHDRAHQILEIFVLLFCIALVWALLLYSPKLVVIKMLIHALARRLSKTHNRAVALKTLIVIHRALREVDPTFQEEFSTMEEAETIMGLFWLERPRTKDLDTPHLLEQLPALQQLLFRVLGCQPQGAAVHNFVIQLALSMVATESIKIYNVISDGSVNLVDKFFEMQRST